MGTFFFDTNRLFIFRYNQNFRGLYCTCSRPYPDPEDPVEDSMIQCIMCEDWFHGRHLMVNAAGAVPGALTRLNS